MAAESSMQKIYEGTFSKDLLDLPAPAFDAEKVESILTAYGELVREFPPVTLEALGRIPNEMLHKLARIGLFGLSIPKAYGGLGFNTWEYMKVVEQMVPMDMAAALASLAHLSIGVKGIELFGNEAQKQKYLVPAASGEIIFAYALTEPRIGSDAQHLETRAELAPDGNHYLLNGQKTYITNANYAGAITVFAQMDPARPGFMGAFIVETNWPGVIIGKDMPKMGLKASSTAAIQFRNVKVPVENLIGAPGDGFKLAMTIINYGRLALGAASAGMMRKSLEDMIKRSSSRVQFGVPIKEFPLIQEKLAKARVNCFVCGAINDLTATLLHANPKGNLAIETSHCKLFGTTRAWETLYEAFQVAGGSGYIATNPYEKRLRDFRVATVFEGTTEIHSIYPALSALRNLSKHAKELDNQKSSLLRFFLGNFFRRVEWPLAFKDRTLQGASRLARANANAIRRLLLLGLVVYRKKAPEKQFWLRRITTLSLYLFGLMAVLVKLAPEEKAGSLKKEELALLRCFLDEAKQTRRQDRRLFDSRKERATTAIAQGLYPRQE
jgi:acyl-CoA dehydrogenase family member 9